MGCVMKGRGGKYKGQKLMPNTPKKYKGFSKLPEAVQQKMDPEAAMKYMEGGA